MARWIDEAMAVCWVTIRNLQLWAGWEDPALSNLELSEESLTAADLLEIGLADPSLDAARVCTDKFVSLFT